jgi:hypothetical protein
LRRQGRGWVPSVIGAFRHARYANIAHARDDQRILTLYGYA